jgi:hypothetical protein
MSAYVSGSGIGVIVYWVVSNASMLLAKRRRDDPRRARCDELDVLSEALIAVLNREAQRRSREHVVHA